jgi:hypothetical protein
MVGYEPSSPEGISMTDVATATRVPEDIGVVSLFGIEPREGSETH